MDVILLVRPFVPLFYARHLTYRFDYAERLVRSIVQTAESSVDVYIRKIEKEKACVDECARLVEATRRFDPFCSAKIPNH
jgi:hypothetical protein